MTGTDFASAAEHVDEAIAVLRSHPNNSALDFYGELETRAPEIRSWLAELVQDPAGYHHGVYPCDSLVAAQAWRLAFPAFAPVTFPAGTQRTPEGWEVKEPTFWFGPNHVPGGLDLHAPLVVLGDLEVEGLLDDGDVFESHLAVSGNIRARALASAADHLTLGDVEAAVIWCFNSDGMLTIGGNVTADLVAPEQHAWGCEGELRARAVGEDYCSGDPLAEQLAPWLPAEYVHLGEDEPLAVWRILTEAAAGHSPVLDTPRPITP
ncbi:MAG TPA: hypothetical protein VGM10_28770 [Actinocrinis sp.]